MGKEPPASLRRDDGAQREVAGSGWVGAMRTGSPVARMRAGRETERRFVASAAGSFTRWEKRTEKRVW